jgi:hypothetical protein
MPGSFLRFAGATLALLINDEYVDDAAFVAEFRQLGGLNIDPKHPAAQYEAATLSRMAEERVIGRVLLRQRALAEGFNVTADEVEARREEQWGTSSASVCGAGVQNAIGEGLLIEKYCNWITRHEPRASRADVEAWYRSRREDFRMPEQVKLMQVVRNIYLPEDEAAAQEAMNSAQQELAAGTRFEKVADRYSDCGGKVMLGWVGRGAMVPEFEDVAFALAKGQHSGIFRTIFGLHILSVTDRRAAGYQSLEEVRPLLAKQLLQMRKEQRINQEATEAMQAATITTVAPRHEASLHG